MRFAKNLACFVLGLLIVIIGRRALLPPVPGPLAQASAPLIAERASCSVLFLGPSYVERQIDTDIFNREAERIGFDARACKFGTSSFRGYELRLWIERFLEHDWPRLNVVVIDITLGDGIGFNPENWLKPRIVEWHTWDAMPWLIEYYQQRGSLPLREKVPTLWAHAKHVAAHYVELGQGVEALGSLRLIERFRPEPPRGESPSAARRDESDGNPARDARVRRKKKVRGPDYQRHVARMVSRTQRRGRALGNSEWALELRSVVRARRIDAYFLIAPVLYSPPLPRRALVGRDRLVVLDFNDPSSYPELYREDVRGNTSHLAGEGIRIYSELLARKLAARPPRRLRR